jgi:hypothetical protein
VELTELESVPVFEVLAVRLAVLDSVPVLFVDIV